jgi:hypothetical protein
MPIFFVPPQHRVCPDCDVFVPIAISVAFVVFTIVFLCAAVFLIGFVERRICKKPTSNRIIEKPK